MKTALGTRHGMDEAHAGPIRGLRWDAGATEPPSTMTAQNKAEAGRALPKPCFWSAQFSCGFILGSVDTK